MKALNKLTRGILSFSFLGAVGLIVDHSYRKERDDGAYPHQVAKAAVTLAAPAILGVGGVELDVDNASIKNPNRYRLAQVDDISPQVKNVNAICDNHGIPLTERLADLFILQHQVGAKDGSSCDFAFESMIKQAFQEECDKGCDPKDLLLSNFASLNSLEHPELLSEMIKQVDAFNQAGYLAHLVYQKYKVFKCHLIFSGASPVHNERYGKEGVYLSTRRDLFDTETLRYMTAINDSINYIEFTVRKHRAKNGWEPHSKLENCFRNELVEEQADKIRSLKNQILKERYKITFFESEPEGEQPVHKGSTPG